MRTCATCSSYVSAKSQASPAEQGFCRRYPPQLLVLMVEDEQGKIREGLQSRFPEVPGDWGCQEHRPAPKAAKAAKAA